MDMETCPAWQTALYVQVRHTNPKDKKDWFYKTNSGQKKDSFYLAFNGLRLVFQIFVEFVVVKAFVENFQRNIEVKTGGKTRADAKTCLENAYVDRLNAVGDDDSDYTKVSSHCH